MISTLFVIYLFGEKIWLLVVIELMHQDSEYDNLLNNFFVSSSNIFQWLVRLLVLLWCFM